MKKGLGDKEEEFRWGVNGFGIGEDSEVIERGEGERGGAIEFGGFGAEEGTISAGDDVGFESAGGSGMRLRGVLNEIDGGGGDECEVGIKAVEEVESERISKAVASLINGAAGKEQIDIGIAAEDGEDVNHIGKDAQAEIGGFKEVGDGDRNGGNIEEDELIRLNETDGERGDFTFGGDFGHAAAIGFRHLQFFSERNSPAVSAFKQAVLLKGRQILTDTVLCEVELRGEVFNQNFAALIKQVENELVSFFSKHLNQTFLCNVALSI